MRQFHQPVLSDEVIHYLRPSRGGKFIDGTLGGAGHTARILERIWPDGQVLGIDLDPIAIAASRQAIQKNKNNLIIVQDNFKNINKIAHVHKFNKIDGILLDLGLSSGQLSDQKRGFSFLAEGDLDMRFGGSASDAAGLKAQDILNHYSQQDLIGIFKNYGEERLALTIAKKIIESRKVKSISAPAELVSIVSDVYRKHYRVQSKTNPATKIFQALRIAVNDELNNLRTVLPEAVALLKAGGRLAIISYHSLEDRIVKDFFKQESRDCLCSPETPVCVCGHKRSLKIITKKPVVPSSREVVDNPRSRSAKLRVAEKV